MGQFAISAKFTSLQKFQELGEIDSDRASCRTTLCVLRLIGSHQVMDNGFMVIIYEG